MSGKAAKAAESGNGAPPAAATEKKKRNSNPGVRQQGGRIYDSENGTTCHQCRQKTIEVKAKCQSCTFHFCPRCLENRYSEVVAVVNAVPGWACPRCRGACNCSNCRKTAGLEATGILANIAKTAGFGSVSDLLRKNPKAQALNMMHKGEAAAGGSPGEHPKAAPPKRPAVPRPKRKAAEEDLVDDAHLGARPAPMPEAQPLALHKDGHAAGRGAGGGAKRHRGPAWLDKLPATSPLPADVDASKLACILEFVAVFGAPALGLRGPSLPAVAAELVHPAARRRADQMSPVPEDSALAALQQRLLEVVRAAWGVTGAVGLSAWQPLMRAYYAAALMTPEALKALREEHQQHQPPAVAGELFVRPPEGSDVEEEAGEEGGSCAGYLDGAARGGVAAAAAGVEFPEGGYWGLSPGLRVSMLYALVHDALDVHAVRSVIEEGLGGAAAGDKERRSELAEVRRAAKEAAAKQRDHEIALIIAGGAAKAMTLEEQREVMGAAAARAEAAAGAAAAARVCSLTGAVHPPTVRVAPLGQDREGRVLYSLQAAPTLTGQGEGLVVLRGSDEGAAALPDAAAVARALDPRGRREGPLRHAIAAACKLPPSALQTAALGAAAAASTVPPDRQSDGATKRGRKRQSPVVEELTPASPLPCRMQKAGKAPARERATPKIAAARRAGGRGLVAASPE